MKKACTARMETRLEPAMATLAAKMAGPKMPANFSTTAKKPKNSPVRWLGTMLAKSDLLSAYWGRPMYIAANVLLPAGYDEHPDARYPVVYQHGHYPGPSPFSFREDGGNAFSAWWLSSEQRDRVIAVTFRHENPFYDDSYAVNSANLGPYGDAITKELMPELDHRFRTQGSAWARSLTGGSTGGWESLAQQVFYPELYSSTFSTCPDPVDFRYPSGVPAYTIPGVQTTVRVDASI